MAHDGYPALNQSLNYVLMPVYTLELHGICTGCHKDICRIQRRGQTFPKREKRHVCDYEFGGSAAHDCFGVKTDQLDARG